MARRLLYPLQIDPRGGIAYTEDPARIVQQDLISAVGTQLGERVRNFGYGTRVVDHTFDPNDLDLEHAVEQNIREAISAWMPEVQVLDVEISRDVAAGLIGIDIRYSLNNNTEGRITVPLPLREDFFA